MWLSLFRTQCINNSIIIIKIRGLLVLRGQSGCDPSIQSPLMYIWHNKHYLGAAHGLAGIMTSLLQVQIMEEIEGQNYHLFVVYFLFICLFVCLFRMQQAPLLYLVILV